MKLLDLTVACPHCGSRNVIYSCEPTCCFNHVCGDCLASFELLTRDLGGELAVVENQPGERDSTAPTVACARCESLEVHRVDDGASSNQLVCVSCHAHLELDFSFAASE
jgi:hypothetical protein